MLGIGKSLLCTTGSLLVVAFGLWFDVPGLSQFPLESLFLLSTIAFFAWRPVYLPVCDFDQNEDIPLKESLSRKPAMAAMFLIGVIVGNTGMVMSIIVQSLMQ